MVPRPGEKTAFPAALARRRLLGSKDGGWERGDALEVQWLSFCASAPRKSALASPTSHGAHPCYLAQSGPTKTNRNYSEYPNHSSSGVEAQAALGLVQSEVASWSTHEATQET